MNKRPDPELIDKENPKWTAQEIEHAKRFESLPSDLRDKLKNHSHNNPKRK